MTWIPLMIFVLTGAIESWAVARFFRALEARREFSDALTSPRTGKDLSDPPSALAAALTRLRILFQRHADAATERKRRVALIGMALSVISFFGVVVFGP